PAWAEGTTYQAGAVQATSATALAEGTAAMLLGTKATAAVTVIAAPATTAKIRRLFMAHSPASATRDLHILTFVWLNSKGCLQIAGGSSPTPAAPGRPAVSGAAEGTGARVPRRPPRQAVATVVLDTSPMTNPDLDPDVYPPLDPREPVPETAEELLPGTPNELPAAPTEPMPDDGEPGGVPEPA
ncbi:hypothetical protein AB0J68_26710, partial [Micromonospora sp. NPDC049580]|uniref:hypothetical protein n=2 Tax=Micromonospora TaxID=1873 RepID=UPI0034334773